jgi:hypothetical protein
MQAQQYKYLNPLSAPHGMAVTHYNEISPAIALSGGDADFVMQKCRSLWL